VTPFDSDFWLERFGERDVFNGHCRCSTAIAIKYESVLVRSLQKSFSPTVPHIVVPPLAMAAATMMADSKSMLSVEDAYHSLPDRASAMIMAAHSNTTGIMADEPCGTRSTPLLDWMPSTFPSFCLFCCVTTLVYSLFHKELSEDRRKTIVTAMYLSIAAILGTFLRIAMAQLFGDECANPGTVGWLAASSPLCVTKDGDSEREGGIVFAVCVQNKIMC
jgi:hypothetical protein